MKQFFLISALAGAFAAYSAVAAPQAPSSQVANCLKAAAGQQDTFRRAQGAYTANTKNLFLENELICKGLKPQVVLANDKKFVVKVQDKSNTTWTVDSARKIARLKK